VIEESGGNTLLSTNEVTEASSDETTWISNEHISSEPKNGSSSEVIIENEVNGLEGIYDITKEMAEWTHQTLNFAKVTGEVFNRLTEL
jgi:hypothetical protein